MLVNFASGITGSRALAEDVVQEAWFRIEQAERTQILDRPLQYFYRIVRNLALDSRRRSTFEERHFASDSGDIVGEVADEARSAEDALIARQELDRVMAALALLPERTRLAVEMHRFGGFTLKEIAARLGISIPMAHHLVKDGLRQCMRAL